MFSIQFPHFHRTASAGFVRASIFAFITLAIAHVPEVHARHFTLRWADNSNNESGFKIERAADNENFTQIATTGPNVVSYQDKNISAQATYRYRVRAYNRAGHSSYSNTVTVDTYLLAAVTNTIATTSIAKPGITGNSAPGNTAPTITAIADQVVAVNGSTPSLSFTIGDAQTSAANLILIKNSSDNSVVPVKNIIIGGRGAKRTVTVRPAANKTGWSTIYIKVSNGYLERDISFNVSVQGKLAYANIVSPSQTELPLRFGYLPVKGNSEITVRVASLQAGDDRTRAGIMCRASADINAAYAGVFVTKGSRLVMVSRAATGAPLQTSAALAGSAPRWLRLLREGDMFLGFTSVDGANWDMVEFVTVDLPNTALTGTAATAPGGASESTARFEHFEVD